MSPDGSTSKAPSLILSEKRYNIQQLKQPLERLSAADAANVQEIVASQIELMAVYHNEVIDEARRSFDWAIIAGGVGLLFFLGSVGFIVFRDAQNAALISLTCGALVEFISGINFYLYGKTSHQLADFQARLDTTQRFLLANSICEGLDEGTKQRARSALVGVIAGGNINNLESQAQKSTQKVEENNA